MGLLDKYNALFKGQATGTDYGNIRVETSPEGSVAKRRAAINGQEQSGQLKIKNEELKGGAVGAAGQPQGFSGQGDVNALDRLSPQALFAAGQPTAGTAAAMFPDEWGDYARKGQDAANAYVASPNPSEGGGLGQVPTNLPKGEGLGHPYKEGFFQKLYESTLQKPEMEMSEDELRKARNRANLTDALSLLVQVGQAFAGGNVEPREYGKTASGMLQAREDRMRQLYSADRKSYERGLMEAMGQDYRAANDYWRELKSDRDKITARAEKLEDIKSQRNWQNDRDRLKVLNDNVKSARDLESKFELEKQRLKDNLQLIKARGASQRQIDAQRQADRIYLKKYSEELKSGSKSGAGAGAVPKGMKRVIIPVDKTAPGAVKNEATGKYILQQDMTKEDYAIIVQAARLEEIEGKTDDERVANYLKEHPNAINVEGFKDLPFDAKKVLFETDDNGNPMQYIPSEWAWANGTYEEIQGRINEENRLKRKQQEKKFDKYLK